MANPEQRKDLRRNTRVPIGIRIDLESTGVSCEGETIVVHLHGALVKTSGNLELRARVTLYVQLTSKSAGHGWYLPVASVPWSSDCP